jgi:hypothetical protein
VATSTPQDLNHGDAVLRARPPGRRHFRLRASTSRLRRVLPAPSSSSAPSATRAPWRPAPPTTWGLELASRLSFFLWSTLPDDTLLDLPPKGRLRAPGVLEQQVPGWCWTQSRSAFADNFMGQWLQLRNIRNKQPNSHEFPDFDDNLRRALQNRDRDVRVRPIIREDRSLLDLMTADYTFVNERLAQHYGIRPSTAAISAV